MSGMLWFGAMDLRKFLVLVNYAFGSTSFTNIPDQRTGAVGIAKAKLRMPGTGWLPLVKLRNLDS
jgi:hypothetical protein